MFDQLKAFHATVRQGSITRAARHLGVSQPTIAAQIRQVEQVYGVELFYRSGRKLEITETGIELLPLVEDPSDPLGVLDLVTHHAPLEDAPQLYETFQKKEDGCIKVVLRPEQRSTAAA